MARAASGLEFPRQYVGADSEWLRRANNAHESNGDRASLETGVSAFGEILCRLFTVPVGGSVFQSNVP